MTRDVGERQGELHEMFCSGANRAHLTKVRVHRRSLLCLVDGLGQIPDVFQMCIVFILVGGLEHVLFFHMTWECHHPN